MKCFFKLIITAALLFLFGLAFLSFGANSSHIHFFEFVSEDLPTCIENGSEKYVCACGAVLIDDVPALGHDFKITEYPASCTQNGSIVSTCKRCGYETSEQIKALGHRFSAKYTTDKKATCTAAGSKSRHCVNCEKRTNVTSIPALGHSYGKSKTVTQKASFSVGGETAFVCKTCGAKKDKTVIYKVSSAALSGTVYTYSGKSIKPTVTVKNTKGEKLKAGRDYTVTYDKDTKSIGKHKAVIKLCGNYTSSKTLTYSIIPKNVSSLSAKSVKNGIELKWNAVSGGVKYRVYSYNSKTKSYKTLLNTSNNYCKVSAESGTGYTLCVRAYKTVGDKSFFGKSFTCVKCACAPKAVSLNVKALGSANVKLSWSKVKCTGYEIFFKQDGDYTKMKTITAENGNDYYKNSLKKGKTYTFKIRTYLKFGGKTYYSSFSSPCSVKVK